MSKVAILSCILGEFDTPIDPVVQDFPEGVDKIVFHRFTDKDFPAITGLTPRLQYRIPKLFGWQMFPDYDYYLWVDGSVSLVRQDSAKWFLKQLGNADIAVFKHPYRNTIKEESDYIDDYLNRRRGTRKGQQYLIDRYNNGLHKEQLKDIQLDTDYEDDHLYASTSFIYRDSEEVRDALRLWWLHQSRYYTCDQLAFTYSMRNLDVSVIEENPFKSDHVTLVSRHG